MELIKDIKGMVHTVEFIDSLNMLQVETVDSTYIFYQRLDVPPPYEPIASWPFTA